MADPAPADARRLPPEAMAAFNAGDHLGVIAGLTPVRSRLDVGARFMLAHAHQKAGQYEAAEQAYGEVITRDPDHGGAWMNLANVCRDTNQFKRALRLYDHALKVRPDHASTRLNRSHCRFLVNDWLGGWADFESRLEVHDIVPQTLSFTRGGAPADRDSMRWRGGPVRSLLLIGEQGLGDTLQYARFIRLLVKAGVTVGLMEHTRMTPILRSLGVPFVHVPRVRGVAIGDVEAWAPLGSLPGALGVTAATAEPESPYLKAEPERVAAMRDRVVGPGLKVGVCWRGSADARADQTRFPPVDAVAPLLQAQGCTFYALQPLGEVDAGLRPHLANHDWTTDQDGAFVDTAALIVNLDLVVTVDTSIAHLAGALAAPTWLLLKHRLSDWRWLHGRTDTPWYRTMTLRRQPAQDDWAGLFGSVRTDLERLAAER